MASKQDILKYLEMKYNSNMSEIYDKYSKEREEIDMQIEAKVEDAKSQLKFVNKDKNYFIYNFGDGYSVRVYCRDDNIESKELIRLRELRISSWDGKSGEERKVREKYHEIKKKILLYGVTTDLLELIEGF